MAVATAAIGGTTGGPAPEETFSGGVGVGEGAGVGAGEMLQAWGGFGHSLAM